MKSNPTDAKHAETYNVHRKTVRRWREAGAPLDDPKRMRAWLASRKSTPIGATRGKPKRARTTRRTTPGPAMSEGLPHALKRLEAAEAAAYGRLEAALKEGDPIEVKLARDGWIRLADALRKADLSLEAARRESGELIPQREVARCLAGLAYCLRVGHAEAATQLAVCVSGQDIPGARTILSDRLHSLTMTTLAAVRATIEQRTPGGGLSFPDWMLAPFLNDLGGLYRDVEETIERRRDAIVKAFKATLT